MLGFPSCFDSSCLPSFPKFRPSNTDSFPLFAVISLLVVSLCVPYVCVADAKSKPAFEHRNDESEYLYDPSKLSWSMPQEVFDKIMCVICVSLLV